MPSLYALILALSAAPAEAALPANGSFEQVTPTALPAQWGPIGQTSVIDTDAHSGKRSLRLVRLPGTKAESGVNDSLHPLKPLSGGIDFWYKAVFADDAQLCIYAIPMGAAGIEDTGAPRATFTVPAEHVGDGRWHHARLKYDFTKNAKVRSVHFAARLLGRAGELLLDDFSYVSRVGPMLRVGKMRLEEDELRPGRRALLRVEVENAGDVPLADARLALRLPQGLIATPAEARLGQFAADAKERVEFRLQGARTAPGTVQAVAAGGGAEAQGILRLARSLVIRSFGPASPVSPRGQPTRVECQLTNPGNVTVLALQVRFHLPTGDVLRTAPELPPGKTAILFAEFTPASQSPEVPIGATVACSNLPERPTARSRLVVGTEIEPPPASGKLQAMAGAGAAVLENEHLRLVFRRNDFGFGPGELAAKTADGWRSLAWLTRLSRLVYRPKGGARQDVTALATSAQTGPDASLRFQLATPDGACWIQCEFSLRRDAKLIAARYTLEAKRPLDLLAFEGPMLHVLDRQEAIFPGLEWLVDDELSSDTLDIAQSHPDRLRHVVHPNMITIPAIGIRSSAGCAGLLWDVYQKWDGRRDRPSAVFASPDRFENQRSHVAGLILPTVPEYLDPNTLEAARPYPLPAGKSLSLECQLLADGAAADALAAVDQWVARYGLPPASPLPHGSYPAEIQFSMRAYLESLWVPESQEWWTTKGGGGMSHKGRPHSHLADLLVGELLSPNPDVRAQCRRRAEEVAALLRSPARLDAQRFPGRADLGMADPHNAAGLLASLGDDAGWRFDADLKAGFPFEGMDYHEIGPDNAVELGTCAQRAYMVLKFARVAGDRDAFERMRKTLELMEEFRVPRAAQVWEVPVHTPDVLAAADAVDAFLEAYRFSGERRWLAAAAAWARRGLPFIYLWSDREKPFLLGASIPVFGASWYECSWFGRPVQWNGLRYADALLKLAEHDRSYPWRQIAEMVIHSAIHQQDADGPNVALWPDNISAIDSQKCPWVFSPRMIVASVTRLMGRDEEPNTVILGRLLHLTSTAKISHETWNGNRLQFQAQFPPGEQGIVLVSNVGRPAAVTLDGKPIRERPDLENGAEPGWRYDPAYAFLSIRLVREGPNSLQVDAARYETAERLPRLAAAIDFTFSKSCQGWHPQHDIEELAVRDGVLSGKIVGPDPYLGRSMLRVRGDDVPVILVRMRVTAGQGGQLFWGTEAAPGFSEDRTIRFDLKSDGQMHLYRLEVGKHPGWKGQTINALRLDPGNGARSAEFAVEFICGEKLR